MGWAKEGYVRDHAAKALGQIGPAAKAAVPALTKLVKERDVFSHRSAAEALKKIDLAPTPKDGTP